MVLPLLFALAALIGVMLLAVGLRGRVVDNHPVCRKCRFDLVGVYPAAGTCPECGAALAGEGAVRRGNRRKRRGLVQAGTVLVVPAALFLIGTVIAVAAGYDLNRLKPVSWLEHDLRHGGIVTSEAAAVEIERRMKAGDLTEERISRVIDLILDRQATFPDADSNNQPMRAAFNFFDLAVSKKLVSEEQFVRAVQQALRVVPRARSRTPTGTALVVESTVEFAPFSESTHGSLVMDVATSVPGRILQEQIPSIRTTEARGISDSFVYHRPIIDLDPGDHELEIAYDFELHQPGYVPTPGLKPPAPRAKWKLVRRLPLRVTERGTPVVELNCDAEIAKAVERLKLRDHEIQVERSVGGRTVLLGGLDCTSCPIDLFCKVVVRSGDTEFDAGSFEYWVSRGWPLCALSIVDTGQITTETVDIILKPSPQAAALATTFDEIWGEPIIFRDVKVIGLTVQRGETDDDGG